MKKNVLLWLLMFCAMLTLVGCGVFTLAGNEDVLIKTGSYVWKIKNPSGSTRHDRLYIKSSGESLEFYFGGFALLRATRTENRFEGLTEDGEENTYINGTVDVKGQVTGYYDSWNVFEPNKKSRYEFVVQEDTSPDAKAYWDKYFKGLAQMQDRDSKFIFSKTDEYGCKMRARIEKMSKEEDVSFVVKGKVIDSTGQPIGGIVIRLSARANDPDGPMGMGTKIKYLTSNKGGFFESEVLFGNLLEISYRGKEYQYFYKSIVGKEELLKLKDNPVIIKLEPSAKQIEPNVKKIESSAKQIEQRALEQRTLIEKAAKEENVSFAVKGKVIDSTGHPIAGIVIRLTASAYDPYAPKGMRDKTKYVTSNKDGFFESELFTGHVFFISYKGKEYQLFHKSFLNKGEILQLKDNPIIIKLEKSAKENHVKIVGRVVDSENKPITSADVVVIIRSTAPAGIWGEETICKYILTDKEGKFELGNRFGTSVKISAYKTGYNNADKTFDGPEELKKLKDNPVIIKLEPKAN